MGSRHGPSPRQSLASLTSLDPDVPAVTHSHRCVHHAGPPPRPSCLPPAPVVTPTPLHLTSSWLPCRLGLLQCPWRPHLTQSPEPSAAEWPGVAVWSPPGEAVPATAAPPTPGLTCPLGRCREPALPPSSGMNPQARCRNPKNHPGQRGPFTHRGPGSGCGATMRLLRSPGGSLSCPRSSPLANRLL